MRICRWSSAAAAASARRNLEISAATCTRQRRLAAAALERGRAGARDFLLRMAAAAAGILEPPRLAARRVSALGTTAQGLTAVACRPRFCGERRGHAASRWPRRRQFDEISGALSVTACGRPLDPVRPARARDARRTPRSGLEIRRELARQRGGLAGFARAAPAICAPIPCCRSADCCRNKDIRERLREIAPSGEWIDTAIALDPQTRPTDPWRLQVQAKFRDVGFAPVGRAPGLRGLTRHDRRQRERRARRHRYAHGGIHLAGAISPARSNLDALKATLYWKRTDEELLVATPDWRDEESRRRAFTGKRRGGSPPTVPRRC